MQSVCLAKCLKYFYKFKKKHIIIVCIKLILLSLVAVLLADYRAEPEPDRLPLRTTRRGYLRKTLSTSTRPAIKSSTAHADTNTQNPSFLSATASVPKPFNYSSESLNQTHADMFKDWIDSKSTELYELSLNYSGFKLLNATYNVQLRKDAKFAWINFTEMIINISQTISQVLHHKTLIVKNLTDMVEKTFDEYRSDSSRVKESASYAYYDAKSPKTFCDVQKAASNDSKDSEDSEEEVATTGSMEVATVPVNVTRKHRVKQKVNKSSVSEGMGFRKRHNVKLDDELDLFDLIDDEIEFDYMPRQFGQVKRYVHSKSDECPLSGTVHGHLKVGKRSVNRENGVRKGKFRRPGLVRRPKNQTTTKATTTTTQSPANDYYYDFMEKNNDLDTYDYTAVEYALKGKIPFWNVSCINRTYDENFKAFKKGINRNQSTIHVPTNVYRQDLDINMTAYWTEGLDKHFKKNYDQDNEIFWQYFCSSNGLYRRFPGAYWNVPIYEDFFDCRLQSWYIMAAASSKDVLILLDVSGSMTGLKLEIAKKLIEAIMDTLSDNDFFNILLFSDEVRFLIDKANETHYRNRFVQAGRTNKKFFIERLRWFKNTDNVADVVKGLTKSFELLLSKDLNTDTCGCNKVIMLLTDGISENAEQVFRKYNWENGRQVRVFTYLIGREMTDSRHLEWMACANDGHYFHVATLADINEHVHEYIPVLSRPMALTGRHETTWSNVFIGHLDKELKIAVARPAFKTKSSLLSKTDLLKRDDEYFRNLLQKESTTTRLQMVENPYYDPDYYYYYYEYEDDPVDQLDTNVAKPTEDETDEEDAEQAEARDIEILKKTYDIIRNQDVLLGVVGVDVPVLKMISKVSPKYQMGVGIYIIMLDNNGFIVFHPSIKKEITNNFNVKGTSNSIDMDRFEIPIDNGEEFEMLEHEMIDQKTGNKTLNNWKREGLRVIRRRTEYVYTSVDRTPFSVAIASPSSFGRYYIDLPSKKERDYELKLEHLVHNNFETLIQIYNCTYNYSRLIEKLLHPKQYMDFCIRYLFHDPDQVLAIKSDLVFHDIYYKQYNFSMHLEYPNLVKSSFYGTYSGITFFMPVTFYRSHQGLTVAQLLHNNYSFKSDMRPANTWSQIPEPTAPAKTSHTEPQTEMTMNVQLGYIIEPLFKTSTKSAINATNATNSSGVYRDSVNLLSTDSNKHTYSFEKQFYTRSIEFSDYLRTEFHMSEPMVNYFLNESSREVRRDTIGATLSIWLDKVPTAVTGVMYDAHLFQYFLFENYMRPGCDHTTCRNLCSLKRAMNLSCYLVDEHGIVVLSTQERVSRQIKEPIGQPLYKVNPWLMKILEFEGIYDLVIPGKQLPECRQESRIFNSSSRLKNTVIFVFNFMLKLFSQVCVMLLFKSAPKPVSSQLNPTLSLADHIRIFNNEWRGKNSHCYNFGVYSFNLTKWNSLDASELRVWCNSTNNTQRKFLVGPVKHSNLIMLVVEEEFELIHCGNLSQLISNYQPPVPVLSNFTNDSSIDNGTSSDVVFSNVTNLDLRQEFTINRYRNKPEQCHNYFENEKEYLPCFNDAKLYRSITLIQMVCLYIYFFKV